MATSFFNIAEPGLIYSQRMTFRADPAELPADPQNVLCPIAGEWLTLSANRLVRPGGGTVAVSALTIAFPILTDRGRTDVQSSAVAGLNTTDGPGSKLTVLMHKGAICTTSLFATLLNGATAITYVEGDTLIVASFVDQDGNVRVGLTKAGAAITTPGTTEEGDLVEYSTLAVARVIRPPYSISGVGMNAGRGFPAQATNASPAGLRQVMDIQIL